MNMITSIRTAYGEKEGISIREIGALPLAYIGDTVYDLYVRTFLVKFQGGTAHSLHMRASSMVKASSQAAAFRIIENALTEEEKAVFHRGRNAHSGTVPKNATVTDYRIATGVEALFGYLYLAGMDERMNELMEMIFENSMEVK